MLVTSVVPGSRTTHIREDWRTYSLAAGQGGRNQRGTAPPATLRVVLSLLVVLVWTGGGQATEPALQFTSPTEFQVHPLGDLLPEDMDPSDRDWHGREGIKGKYFSTLSAQQADGGSLTFTVEGQSGAESSYCYESQCGPVQVRVAEGSGLLFLGASRPAPRNDNERMTVNRGRLRRMKSRFEDFPSQRVEVSVQAGQQKVHQEVRVTAPAAAPDCQDYPRRNEDRYRCYFTREITPAAFQVANSPLVDDLPGQLVQDREEYGLVFAEEFTGSYVPVDPDPDTETDTATYAATYGDTCDRGLAELDDTKWNYRKKACRAQPQGVPCGYLQGGHLHMSATSQCGSGALTGGFFQPRYGYVEVQFTVHKYRPHPFYANYNMLMGDVRRSETHLLHSYGLTLDSLEQLLTLVPWVEIDLIEYVPRDVWIAAHQYRNYRQYGVATHHPAVRPMRVDRNWDYCEGPDGYCGGDWQERLTMTYGMEWTPGGYLFLRRVHGHEETLQIWPSSGIGIGESRGQDAHGQWRNQFRFLHTDAERAPYLVPLDPADPAFYLQAVGVSHAPSFIDISAWGYNISTTTTQSELTIDHIRVFQPRNRYADMEPVYQ